MVLFAIEIHDPVVDVVRLHSPSHVDFQGAAVEVSRGGVEGGARREAKGGLGEREHAVVLPDCPDPRLHSRLRSTRR